MTRTRILAFSGSTRKESFNQRLVSAAAVAAEKQGAEITLVNLAAYPMPLFNQDDEAANGQPETTASLKELCTQHDGFLIAAPEYNGSITPLLKNTLDWLSRKHGDEASMQAYRGKTAALLSASGGRLGGLRGLVHVRQILTNLGVLVIPKQFAMSAAHEGFAASGTLARKLDQKSVDELARALVNTTSSLATN